MNTHLNISLSYQTAGDAPINVNSKFRFMKSHPQVGKKFGITCAINHQLNFNRSKVNIVNEHLAQFSRF
ncbi:CLUMA_CG010682, isoform A [Clunio marinus]|uniref:CLUMA_CG010682, isoform A n=1 Tax=Clunio marinus TaxID=568069 RepID=A0A1J1IAH8_9DIPT|nr:CLUMA_CG010682, isoform A [Clunio marinus]